MIFKIALAASFLILTSCETSLFGGEQNKATKFDYGPETSQDAIVEALGNSVADYDPNTMAVGEFAWLDKTQQIDGTTRLVGDIAHNAVSRSEDAASVTFRVTENKRSFDENGNITEKVDSEFGVTFQKASNASTSNFSQSAAQFGDPLFRLRAAEEELRQRGDQSVTFHNLKASMNVEPLSSYTQTPNCGNLPNCSIRVHRIGYDMVIWENGKGEVLHREYKISPDAPYLAVILEECLSGIVPIKTTSVFVRECTTARSFKFGTSSVTP